MKSRLTIVVGVTGGIAAYKAVGVVRAFVLAGHDVHVVATDAALRFVGKPTLEAISRNPVATDLYDQVAQVRHVALGQAADLIVIAPATANTIARLAAGLADDLLGTTVLASTAPLVIAPAMHTGMWANAATTANVATLRERGVIIVGPADGQLTGDDSGPGRMAEPAEIVTAAIAAAAGTMHDALDGLETIAVGDLVGRRIAISAGGTREPLDPVRYLGNRSSGRQGIALATAARDRGAAVTLIAAHVEVPLPDGLNVRQVDTAAELRQAVTELADDVDTIVMAAAVADFRPSTVAEHKLKKNADQERYGVELVKNPDILAELASARRPGQLIVGFAAETEPDPEQLIRIAKEKLFAKGCDFLVVNHVGWSEGFGADVNEVVMLDRRGTVVMEASGRKLSVADRILDVIAGPR